MPEPLINLLSVVAAIVGFGFIIFVHELGHFVAAKLFKVHVKAFSLGFPPNIVHKTIGETDYRIGAIPMGGYVSMVGEDPTEKVEDPRALSNQKPWKRGIVFLAGVGMNLLSAVAIYMIASFIGVPAVPAIVGGIAPGAPAEQARLIDGPQDARQRGLQVGDVITAIDGQRVRKFDDIGALLLGGALLDPDHEFTIGVIRDEQPLQFAIVSTPQDHPGTDMQVPKFGIEPPAPPLAIDIKKDSPAHQMGLRKGDRIISVDGQAIPFLPQAQRAFNLPGSEKMTITVERPTGTDGQSEEITLSVDPQQITTPWYDLLPPPYVGSVRKDSPAAAAGIKEGDWIIGIEGRKDRPLSFEHITSTISAAGERPVEMTLLRDAETITVTVTPEFDPVADRPLIGVMFSGVPDIDAAPQVVHTVEGGPLDLAGVPAGSTIISVNDQKVGKWSDYGEALAKLDGKPANITYQPKDGEATEKATIEPQPVKPQNLLEGFQGDLLRERMEPIYNPLEALSIGLDQIKRVTVLQYVTIRGLFVGKVDTKELGGPISIGTNFYTVARTGKIPEFVSFLALVSIAIALLNIMPIPPLDGGHIMFLVVEKVIGRPVPEKLRTTVTMIGTILLLSLVVLVFYNDIRRVVVTYFY